MRTGTGEAIQDLSHVFTDTAAQVTRIPIEAVPDHNIGIITIITGVAHQIPLKSPGIPHNRSYGHQPCHDLTVNTPHRPHCRSSAHRSSSYHSRDRSLSCQVHHTNPHDETHIGHTHTPVDHEANHITRRTTSIEDRRATYRLL